jgi:succinoglycan biosynthesis transport protein ExoP
LKAVSAGSEAGDPGRLAESDKIRALIEQTAAAYDLVILDSPALCEAGDAAMFGRCADGFAVVVGLCKVKKTDFLEALDLTKEAGINLAGVVLNNPPLDDPCLTLWQKLVFWRKAGARSSSEDNV